MKDAYYFSHDANARNDQRLLAIRIKYGMRGYGIYFGIIEILRESAGYQMINDCSTLAYDLREDVETITDVVKNFGLFDFKDKLFFSKSLKNRMKEMDENRIKRSIAGRKGGLASASKRSTTVQRPSSSKVKESKVNESTTKFDTFYSKYPKKQDRTTALKAFLKISPNDALFETMMGSVEAWSKSEAWLKENGKYVPMPSTWLNQERWTDEVSLNGKDPYAITKDQKF